MLMRYKRAMLPAQLNLLDSHDVSRFRSVCGSEARFRLAVLFQFCFVGMPTVFYGDELGIQGITEEEFRAPMPWDGGNLSLLGFYRRAIAMRRTLAPLRYGTFRMLWAEKGSHLIAFYRQHDDKTVTVCLNAGTGTAALPPVEGKVYWAEGLQGSTLDAFGFAVFAD